MKDLISRISLKQSIAVSAILKDKKTLEQIIDEEPSIDAVPQWIPCSEMLPDGRLNKSYLVQDKDGRRAVGTYTNWGWMFGHYMNDPVAWMPLPKPYEAERKES